MNEIPDVVGNPAEFYNNLTEILLLLKEDGDFDAWFINNLKPLITLNNQNWLAAQLAIKAIATSDHRKGFFPLLKVLEATDKLAMNNDEFCFF